jgi:hypothetical protein
MPLNRPNRPGLGYTICIVLSGLLALFGGIACYALTSYDMGHRLPNPVITDVAVATGVAAVLTAVLIASYLAQVRVLDALDRIEGVLSSVNDKVTELKEDTGQIPKLATAVVDAPEIVIVHHGPREYQYMDREAAMAVIQQAAQPTPVELPDELVRRISRRSFELGRRIERGRGDGPEDQLN